MAIFDFRCYECLAFKEDVLLPMGVTECMCVCGAMMQKHWGNTRHGVHAFKSGMYEHVGPDPVYVGSKAELRARTRDNGLTSDYAE